MVRTLNRTEGTASRSRDADFKEFVTEMPAAVNGVVFVWSDKLKQILQQFRDFAQDFAGEADPAWEQANRQLAENRVFRAKYQQYMTKARIPDSEKQAFDAEVLVEMDRMWRASGENVVADAQTLDQLEEFAGVFRSAYLQMSLTKDSLQVWGRALAPGYRR